jgi:4-amino-4-deoxy-L-arabinose transferase-like glycosyltransferase
MTDTVQNSRSVSLAGLCRSVEKNWQAIRIQLNNRQAKQWDQHDNLVVVLTALLGLVLFLLLYQLRVLDDNRLTSWQWVFSGISILKVFIILTIGMVVAYVFSIISIPERKQALFLFISSFIAAMFLWDGPEVIIDTSRYFVQAKYVELYGIGYFLGEWGKEIMAWTDLPLVPLLYGLVFDLFGENRLGIQVFNTLLFSGTIVLTYLIGSMLWDRTVGFYGGLLLLGMPYLLTQVPLMLVDVPTMFFITLAVYTTIKALRQGGTTSLVMAAIAIALAALSKYSAWLMLSIIPVIAACHLSREWRPVVKQTTLIMLGAGLLVGIFIVLKLDVVTEQIRLLLSYQLPALGRWGESFTSSFLFQTHPFITVAALVAVYLAVKKRDTRFAIVFWLLLLVALLGIKRLRYIIPILPMVALMAAYGIRQVANARVGKFIVSSVAVFGVVIAVFVYMPFFMKTSLVNIKVAGAYLNSMRAPKIAVVTLPTYRSSVNPVVSVPILDLFTRKTIVYQENGGRTPRPGWVERSPLRFTWEFGRPRFFNGNADLSKAPLPVVVIFSDPEQILPDQIAKRIAGYRLVNESALSDKVFRYQTIVRVYEPV